MAAASVFSREFAADVIFGSTVVVDADAGEFFRIDEDGVGVADDVRCCCVGIGGFLFVEEGERFDEDDNGVAPEVAGRLDVEAPNRIVCVCLLKQI